MYEVFVSSKEFKGKRIVQQHRIVNEVSYLEVFSFCHAQLDIGKHNKDMSQNRDKAANFIRKL